MIALYKGVSVPSKLIRWRNWSHYSHASWVEEDQSEIEAWLGDGVVRRENYMSGHSPGTVVDLYDVPLTVGERDGLREFYASQIGKPYDLAGVLRFVSKRPADPDNQETWFCSELIFAGFLHIRMPLLFRIAAYKVYPGMLSTSPLVRKIGSVTAQGGSKNE